MIHEIAAAWIVGGFIICNKPYVKAGAWWLGALIILIASACGIGNPAAL